MKIGIISDSHDNIENIKKAVKIFKDEKAELVVHLGDYVNMLAIKEFAGLNFFGVFGNNDGDKIRIIKAFNEINGEIKSDFLEFERDGLKFAAYHGTEPEIKEALIYCARYDVVLCGHTHIAENKKIGKTIFVNPGSAHGFGGKATIVVFDTKTKEARFKEF